MINEVVVCLHVYTSCSLSDWCVCTCGLCGVGWGVIMIDEVVVCLHVYTSCTLSDWCVCSWGLGEPCSGASSAWK